MYNFNFILDNFGPQCASLLKRWIDIHYKIIRAHSKIQFLKHCKAMKVVPQHITHLTKASYNLKFFHYKANRKLSGLLIDFKSQLIRIEISDLYGYIRFLNKELPSLSRNLSHLLPTFVWDAIKLHHFNSFDNLKHRLFLSHYKKFKGLLINSDKASKKNTKDINYTYCANKNKFLRNTPNSQGSPNDINITIDPNQYDNKSHDLLEHPNDKWFINLTNSPIPHEVTALLQFGERFCLPSYLNKKTAIHEFIKDIESNTAFHNHNFNKQTLVRNISIPRFYNFLKCKPSTNPIDSKLIYLHNVTKRFCRENQNIIFTRADKGNVTVAMNKEFYIHKIEEILNDEHTYTVVTRNPIKSIENNLNNILKHWLQKNYITKQQFYKLRSSDSLLPKAYGLPKIHKNGTPFRLIVSSLNTALYSFGSFLQDIISASLEKTTQCIANSFELYNSLSGMNVGESDILISLDVVSLFTNVPLELAIEGISKRWTNIQQKTRIPKNDFISAVNFVLTSTFFTFNSKIYKQTYGTPMGSPLSPVIADVVMRDLETECLTKINCQPTFYYRYVDDIAMAVPLDSTDSILRTFNSYHERLIFTIEFEESRSLSFLDLLLTLSDNIIHIDWYHKPTFSGRFLSFYSSHPLCHKIGTIYNLTDRAFLLSHAKFHQKNLEIVIDLLLENGYPLSLIFEKINHRLKSLIYNKGNQSVNQSITNMNSTLETNNRKILVLPYIQKMSELVASVVDKSQYITGYRVLNNLRGCIRVHKDSNNLLSNNNVVYKISCKDCSASYVGQTKRQLKTRIREHSSNIRSSLSRHSVITDHILEFSHSFDWENVQILDSEPNYFKRCVSEMLHIKEQQNGLNAQKDTELLDSSYFDILDILSKM